MSYRGFLGIYYFLDSEYRRHGRLSITSFQRGDHGTFLTFCTAFHIFPMYTWRSSLMLRQRFSFCGIYFVLCQSLLSVSRVRHLRRQSAISLSMQTLFHEVSEHHMTYVVTESTGTVRSLHRARQYLILICMLQRWFLTRHLAVG
jgi:hypothetical protein